MKLPIRPQAVQINGLRPDIWSDFEDQIEFWTDLEDQTECLSSLEKFMQIRSQTGVWSDLFYLGLSFGLVLCLETKLVHNI